MISLSLLSTFKDKFGMVDIDIFIINIIIAVILVAVGIFLGKFIGAILKKLVEQAGLSRTAKKNFVNLLLTIIKWSIYILFVSLALDQLGIPQLTNWLTSILVVIPALVGALLLITLGFTIVIYLKDLISETEILEKNVLSMIIFYFILYVFIVFALKTALISLDKNTVNTIIIVLTAVVSAAIAYSHVKKR